MLGTAQTPQAQMPHSMSCCVEDNTGLTAATLFSSCPTVPPACMEPGPHTMMQAQPTFFCVQLPLIIQPV